jgi:hypothetical protein
MRWMKRGGEIIEETEEVVVEEVKEQAPVENMAEEIKEEAPEAVETSYKPKKNKGNKKDLL